MPDEPEGPDDAKAGEQLRAYRAKRSAGRTPEPFGGDPATLSPGAAAAPVEPPAGPAWARPRLFCVQKHAATRLHYDFRLELGGRPALLGGAQGSVARRRGEAHRGRGRGPPGRVRRLRGRDPRGQLRRGRGHRLGQGAAGCRSRTPRRRSPKGKLTFELRGYKLRGAWHLFRTKGKGKQASKDWMLIKRVDGWASATRALPPGVDLLRAHPRGDRTGPERAAEVRAELERLGAPRAGAPGARRSS